MKETKEYYLKKILNSQEFAGSEKYPDLLKYLFESASRGVVPKEVTIAIEVFKLDKEDMGDQSIRVYIYNLRKKLASYYLKEGAEDAIQFTIPKGRYKLEAVQKNLNASRRNRRLTITLIALSTILTLVSLVLIKSARELKIFRSQEVKSDFIWKDFMENDLPVLIVIGDYYLMQDLSDTGHIRFIRDIQINSAYDQDQYLAGHETEGKVTGKTKLTMLGKYAPVCIDDLSRLFFSSKKEYKIILGSEFRFKDLQNSNLVFVGSLKTMNYVKEFFRQVNFEYIIYPNELKFHQLDSDSIYNYYSHGSDFNNAVETDYSILMKLTGMYNSKMIFILSSRDIGLMGIVNLITDPEALAEFEKTHEKELSGTDDFEACFKVEGLYRNVFGIDLVNFNALEN